MRDYGRAVTVGAFQVWARTSETKLAAITKI
jgi:hypothetical protein